MKTNRFKKLTVVLSACMTVFLAGCSSNAVKVATGDDQPAATDTPVHETSVARKASQKNPALIVSEDGQIELQALENAGWQMDPELASAALAVESLPDFSGVQDIEIHGNQPMLPQIDVSSTSFEYYGDLDASGRCTIAAANIGPDLLPTVERSDISSVKPSGFVQNSYDFVDNGYVYNRAHLIAYCLSGENANARNLITGTRSMNLAMVPYETSVLNYVRSTGNHVLYESIPVYTGGNLVADGVLLQARSLEDNGEGIEFCRYIYNVEPGIEIDYTTGENWIAPEDTQTWTYPAEDPDASASVSDTTSAAEDTDVSVPVSNTAPAETQNSYTANKNSGIFHFSECSSAKKMKDANKVFYSSREEALAAGYVPCERCNP